MTHLALWVEIALPGADLEAARSGRWMLGAVVLMHAGIALTLGLTEFSLAMLTGNLAFVSGADPPAWSPASEAVKSADGDAIANRRGAGRAGSRPPHPGRPRR